MIDSTALLHMAHYNTVLIVWFFFFFFPLSSTPDSFFAWNEYYSLQNWLFSDFLFITYCSLCGCLPSSLPSIQTLLWSRRITNFHVHFCGAYHTTRILNKHFFLFFFPLRAGVCYCLYQLRSGSIRRLKFGSEKQNLNFLTAL